MSDLTDLTISRASAARFVGRLCFPKYVGGRPACPLSPRESDLSSLYVYHYYQRKSISSFVSRADFFSVNCKKIFTA